MAEWLVTGAVLVLLVLLAERGYRVQEFRAVAPGLMTSLGILGTFAGIFISLVAFDPSPEQMRESVESLLEGMDQAFVTSLLGLSFSIAFRICEPSFPSTFVATREQSEVFRRLDAIGHALVGEQTSNIAMELQTLRNENRDGFGTLNGLPEIIRGTLDEKLEKMVVQTTEVLTKQFEEHQKMVKVMIDNIEGSLVRQFGDTFVKFNEATHEINKWQKEHRVQVEQLTKAFDQTAGSAARIAADCERIPRTMERLRENIDRSQGVVESLNRQIELLNRQIELFAELRQQADKFFPAASQRFGEAAREILRSAEGLSTVETKLKTTFNHVEMEIESLAEERLNNERKLKEALAFSQEGLLRIAEEHLQSVTRVIADSLADGQRASVGEVTSIVRSSMNSMIANFDREMGRMLADLRSSMNNVVTEMLTKTTGEMTNYGKVLGQSSDVLIAVTEKCADVISAVKGSRR